MSSSLVNKDTALNMNNVEEVLDTDPNLLGFENGLFDIRYMEFRNAKEGEYASMSVGYEWNKEWDVSNIDINDTETWIFPDEEINKKAKELLKKLGDMFHEQEDLIYMLKAFSRCLRGDSNVEKVAHFLSGVGANGKSVLFSLMRLALGDYYQVLPFRCLKAGYRLNPALHDCAKKRFIEASEPNENFVLNADTFKRMTGNDVIQVRRPHQHKITSFKMGHLFIAANYVLQFNTDVSSMKHRVRAANFPFTFRTQKEIDECIDTKKKEVMKLRDNELKNKIERGYYKEAMMWLLMCAYKKYRKEGLVLTPNFKNNTETYLL